MRRANTRFLAIGVVGMRVDMAAGDARTRFGLEQKRDKARGAPYLVCNLVSELDDR